MHKRLLSVAVLAAGAAIAIVPTLPAAAAGSPVLTTGSVGGPAVNAGDVLTAAGTKVTVFTSATNTTGITCTKANLTATVTGNPGSDGNADETASLTTTSCTSNIVGVTKVNSVVLNNQPYTATVTPGGLVTVTGTITSTVSLGTVLGNVTCNYTAINNAGVSPAGPSLTAEAHNTTPANSIVITNNEFDLSSGPGVCPAKGFLSGTVGPVIDTSVSGSPSVFVNPGQP